MQKKRQEERRSLILWATIEEVAESGIEGATIKKIAERIGVSSGLIAYYFSDKNDLMKNALAFGHKMIGQRSRKIRAEGGDRLSAVYQVGLADQSPDVPPLSFWLEYWAHATRDDELKGFRASRMAAWRQSLSGTIKELIDSGDLLPWLDPELTAELLQALLDGLQLKLALDSESISAGRALQAFELLRTLLKGQQVSSAVAQS